jgi:hypothetical protein
MERRFNYRNDHKRFPLLCQLNKILSFPFIFERVLKGAVGIILDFPYDKNYSSTSKKKIGNFFLIWFYLCSIWELNLSTFLVDNRFMLFFFIWMEETFFSELNTSWLNFYILEFNSIENSSDNIWVHFYIFQK